MFSSPSALPLPSPNASAKTRARLHQHTHTRARQNLVLRPTIPSRASHYTQVMTLHCHALHVLLFCADMSRMQLTMRADLPSHTHPTPACIGTSVVRIVYTCHPPALHATESPLSQALDPLHLGVVAGRFRHFSWLTLRAPAPAAPARHLARCVRHASTRLRSCHESASSSPSSYSTSNQCPSHPSTRPKLVA